MKEFPRLTAVDCLEESAGCLYRYVRGHEDRFNPHKHDYYEIFITISGEINHWVNGKITKLPEGSLVFIRPDDTHGYLYPDDKSRECEYINLTFSKEIANLLFSYLYENGALTQNLLTMPDPPSVILPSTTKQNLLFVLNQLNTINWDDKQALKLRLKAILADIFVQNFSNMPDREDYKIPFWFKNLTQEMQRVENFVEGTKRMVELSKKSQEHLSRFVKKHLGFTLTEYVNKLRINYSANLLLNTNNSIIDICYMSGFQNLGYFYKVFKKEYKMTPTQFTRYYKI